MSNFVLIFFAVSLAAGEKVPVLLWSSSRPLSDLPQSYTGHTVNTENFKNNYLTPLTTNSKQNLVIFVQDQLSLEDFTKHADVYNPSSDGGAFKNVKAAMDDQYSVHLPSVMKPMVAVDAIIKMFPGAVHRVGNPADLETLPIDETQGNLILVSLTPTRGHNDAEAFAKNDEHMGECMKHLNKRGVEYSALYTAQAASKDNAEINAGRHLLAADLPYVDIYNGTYVNTSSVKLYLRSVMLNVTKGPGNGTKLNTMLSSETLDINDSTQSNNETNLVMKLENDDVIMTLRMETKLVNKTLDWRVETATLELEGKSPAWQSLNASTPIVFQTNITAQLNFSYHCSRIPARHIVVNDSDDGIKVAMTIVGLQYEPFAWNTAFFSDPMDCVGFFTPAIWMGIISTLILMMVLFYGLTMISNISTMDRFDDPKGKTITVTVNE